MQKDSKIYIAGHRGMAGSAIHRNLSAKGYNNFILRTSGELDLSVQQDVDRFFEKERPDYVILAAAKVGGIVANNTYRAEFIYENLMIQNNVIHAAWKHGVKKLLFLGSSCIYPKEAPQPMKEEYLLTGPLEITNEPYAIAKIAGIKMCENYFRQYGCNFISVMPTNLFGPNDNYDLEKSHVLPALIRKMHLGKCLGEGNLDAIREDFDRNPVGEVNGSSSEMAILDVLSEFGISRNALSDDEGTNNVDITLWGTGKVYREFLHVDDMAAACVYMMEEVDAETLYNDLGQTHINTGTGEDITIKDLAEVVREVVGFKGVIRWDSSKPDGTIKKQLDVSLLHKLGWMHNIALKDGITGVYQVYQGKVNA
ncbi:MAG: GDP-L-fucose synthase family protein [Bacteroidales bacterium]